MSLGWFELCVVIFFFLVKKNKARNFFSGFVNYFIFATLGLVHTCVSFLYSSASTLMCYTFYLCIHYLQNCFLKKRNCWIMSLFRNTSLEQALKYYSNNLFLHTYMYFAFILKYLPSATRARSKWSQKSKTSCSCVCTYHLLLV